jgi:hemolysin III
MPEITPERYFKEEKANALTHGLGVVLAIVSTPFLLNAADETGASRRELVGVVLFGLSMFILYLASTIYHSVHRPGPKKFCRKLDHIAIYFLIAGTHTPFIIKYLDNTTGWIYLVVLWSLLVLGTVGKLFLLEKWEKLSLLLYLFMGWMFVFVLPVVWPLMSRKVLIWIGIGGLFYTAGVVFYTREKMWYSHAVWHLFVLAGTAGHYVALWKAFGE